MLIKVSTQDYINPDIVAFIVFRFSDTDPSGETAEVTLQGIAKCLPLPGMIARGLLEFMEVNDSLIMPDEAGAPPVATLKSRIAVALRDTWKGATLEQLEAVLSTNKKEAGISAVKAALAELEAEHVIVRINSLYYHNASSEAQTLAQSSRAHHYTTNGTRASCGFTPSDCYLTTVPDDVTCSSCRAIISRFVVICPTPNPDPSIATAALPGAPDQAAEYTDSTVDPKSEN